MSDTSSDNEESGANDKPQVVIHSMTTNETSSAWIASQLSWKQEATDFN